MDKANVFNDWLKENVFIRTSNPLIYNKRYIPFDKVTFQLYKDDKLIASRRITLPKTYFITKKRFKKLKGRFFLDGFVRDVKNMNWHTKGWIILELVQFWKTNIDTK